MDEDEPGRDVASKARKAGASALLALGDAVLAAHGVPPVVSVGVFAADAVLNGARATFRRATDAFGRAVESAAGTDLASALDRIAADDRASQVIAALNSLLDAPSEERARLLGAVLGESVNDEAVNEQDALNVILEIALSLSVAHLRVLQFLELYRGDVEPGKAWVSRNLMLQEIPGYRDVLDGLLAGCAANGTIVQRQAEGMTYGPSQMPEWSVTSLGSLIVGFLRRYTPVDEPPAADAAAH